jgi:hypothetical protein
LANGHAILAMAVLNVFKPFIFLMKIRGLKNYLLLNLDWWECLKKKFLRKSGSAL